VIKGINVEENLVSIITPAFNSAATISETLDSIRVQKHSSWEALVVIDSGTTDSTPDIVESYSKLDPRIKLLRVPNGRGLALSRNYAITRAAGQYIAFLDSDDLWLPEKLEKQIATLKSTGATFSAHAFRRIDFSGKKIGHLLEVPKKITYKRLLINNIVGCLTVVIDRKKFADIQFQETKHEDYLLWLQILKSGHTCIGLNEDLARYRIVPTSRSANKFEMAMVRWKILRWHEKLPPIKSAYYLSAYTLSSLEKYWRF
jgi:teichuronic acid biosynthesis glycosyltransferase TuaG